MKRDEGFIVFMDVVSIIAITILCVVCFIEGENREGFAWFCADLWCLACLIGTIRNFKEL